MTDDTALESPEPAPTAEDRVPVSQKIAYGLGSFNDMWGNWLYPSLVYQVYNIFLGVAPWLISTALFLRLIFDAITDPLFGWLSDNTRSRFGRRRPFILVGSIVAGIALPVLFWVTPGWGSTQVNLLLHWNLDLGFTTWNVDLRDLTVSNYFWFMIGSSAVYMTIVSCFKMPYESLGAELTPAYHERTSVYSYKNAIQKIPEVGLFFAAAFTTLSWFNDPETGEPNILRGAQVYCMILGAIMIVVGIIVFATVKERYYHKVVERKQEKISIADTIWKALRCRPFRAQLAMSLAYGLGTSMVGALGYYATVYYVCGGDVSLGARWNFVMGIAGMVFGLLGIPTFAFIARRIGKRRGMMCVQSAAVAAFVSTWWLYNPDIRWLQPLATGLIAFTGAGFWTLYGSIGADVIDYDELETGKRREGAFKACEQWIMKVGMAIGIGVSGYILSGTGFDAELGGDQTAHTLFMIRFFLPAIPVGGLMIALVATFLFGLTPQRMLEIRDALEAQRGKV